MDIQIFMAHYDSFIDAFLAARAWLHGLPVIYQILILAALVFVSIGVLSIIYYIVKGALQLCVEIVKGIFNLLKTLIDSISGHRRPGQPANLHGRRDRMVKYQANNPPSAISSAAPTAAPGSTPASIPAPQTMAPMPRTISPQAVTTVQILHCPMCGEAFTPEMMALLHKSERIFCEYCGKPLEYSMA